MANIKNMYPFLENTKLSHGEGWDKIVDEFCCGIRYLLESSKEDYGLQIKEITTNNGVLSITYTIKETAPYGLHVIIDALIDNAINQSMSTCELCGLEGDRMLTKKHDGLCVRCENCK